MSSTSAGLNPVGQEIREQLLDPFINAVCGTVRDWAGAEAIVHATGRQTQRPPLADVAATLELTFPEQRGILVLAFPTQTAEALARRVLAETSVAVNDELVRDCLGELANVTAGQAKAMLHGTAFRISFATPKVASGASQNDMAWPSENWLVALLTCELGDFALQLCLDLE